MQSEPVWTAARPWASITATCLLGAAGSSASSRSSASRAPAPDPSSSSARGPYEISALACVATAPTPGAAQGTTAPTENQCDWTATPSWPVSESRARIEYVMGGHPTVRPSDGMPSIAVLGPGGVGGFLAAALDRAGETVTIVAREPTASQINDA